MSFDPEYADRILSNINYIAKFAGSATSGTGVSLFDDISNSFKSFSYDLEHAEKIYVTPQGFQLFAPTAEQNIVTQTNPFVEKTSTNDNMASNAASGLLGGLGGLFANPMMLLILGFIAIMVLKK